MCVIFQRLMLEGNGLGRLAHLPRLRRMPQGNRSIPKSWSLNQGAEATNFASYNRARQWQATAGHLRAPSAHFWLQGCVEIVGYNQGNGKGGVGFPPPLQLQWKCYKVSQATEDHLTELSWNRHTFLSAGNLLFASFPLTPLPLSSCTSYFLGRDFILSMWGKGDCQLWINLALALSLPSILLVWESWRLGFRFWFLSLHIYFPQTASFSFAF